MNGTIVPAACTLALGNDGAVDYGNIQASSLSADALTKLDLKSMDLSIACDAPAKVALTLSNQRLGSAVGTDGSVKDVGSLTDMFDFASC